MAQPPTYSVRRSDYDVTNTVRVSSAPDVRDAVQALFLATWPGINFVPVARAFQDFEMAFTGKMPGYFGVDTVYHDQQHTLDVTLAMARLLVGYERTHARTLKALGAERAAVGILLALFHDIGKSRVPSSRASFTTVSKSPRSAPMPACMPETLRPAASRAALAPFVSRLP